MKSSLNQCKMSLRFKREELKRLWLEDIKYKHMLQTIQAMYVDGCVLREKGAWIVGRERVCVCVCVCVDVDVYDTCNGEREHQVGRE